MNAAPVEGLHSSFSSARIVEFNEAIVVSFTVELLRELVRKLMYIQQLIGNVDDAQNSRSYQE